MRQGPPGATIAVAVEDGIKHPPHLGLAGPPAGSGRRDHGLEDGPLFVGQVTRVWFRVHTLSTFDLLFWNRL